jgi:Tol biopolymer transport system component
VTSLALALAGCVGSASPPQPESFAPSTTPTPASTTPLPSATQAPTSITGLPFVGTLAFKRDVVDGPHLLFTMPASGGDGVQLLDRDDAEQARWSADGSRLSVVVESPTGRIFVGFVDRDGSNFERLLLRDPSLNLGCGAWSRDEASFACEGWDEANPGRTGLWTVAADGTGLARVTNPPAGRQDAPCDFSPDGLRIAFVRINLADEDRNALMIVNRDGSREHKLIDDAVMLRCRWSPDGSTILATTAAGILAVDMAESGPSATLLPVQVPSGARFSHPAWAVDGKHVAFSMALPVQPFDIWVANADGSGATQVTNTPGIDEGVESWGP